MHWRISKTLRIMAIVTALVVGLMMVLGGTALAIINGQPDGENHPYVCVVAILDESGANIIGFGSGTLIAPNIVLTAGHVTAAGTQVLVTFAKDINQATYFIPGIPITHPDYQMGAAPGLPGFATHDVGVIYLLAPAPVTEYGALPSEGMVDSLAPMTDLDLVGYGVNYRDRPSQDWVWNMARYYAPAELIPSQDAISDEFIKVTSNPAAGKGGTAFGDSGGPTFLGGTNIILGLTSFGTNYNCAGTGYASRVDTADVLGWVSGFLP